MCTALNLLFANSEPKIMTKEKIDTVDRNVINMTKSDPTIIMLDLSGTFEENLDRTSTKILLSKCELCLSNKPKFLTLKYKHYTSKNNVKRDVSRSSTQKVRKCVGPKIISNYSATHNNLYPCTK